LILGVAVVFLSRDRTPEKILVESSSTTSTPTTSTVPAPPTPEEVFQDHYNKAQTLIAEGNKSGARDENTAALAALPNDARGLEQLKVIEALVDPNAPATTSPATASAPPKSPVSTVPEPLRVAAKPGEPERDRAARENAARGHLDQGRAALAEHRIDAAVTSLQAALAQSGRPDFGATPGEAGSLLARARKEQSAAIAAARNAAAQRAVADARALGSSDIPAAIQKLRDARALDPEVDGPAELEKTLLEQARIQGESALGLAKNFDARPGREDQAAREYERAARLLEQLPGGHKDLAFARQRLADLKR
jgi:hypothetical protein